MTPPSNPMKALLWIALALFGIMLVVGVSGGFGAWQSSGDGWMGGMMAWGWMWMLVPLAFMALMMYFMMNMGHGNHSHGENRSNDALAVLERRYASGAIAREEYLRVKADLQGGRHP